MSKKMSFSDRFLTLWIIYRHGGWSFGGSPRDVGVGETSIVVSPSLIFQSSQRRSSQFSEVPSCH